MSFTDFPEVALVNTLARFPLKSIARFRLVSKEWRSLLDSDFFRDYYISFNSSSTSISWSIIQINPHKLSLEIVGHHGCERWGLSKSPASFPTFFAESPIAKLKVLSCTDGLVSIYAEDIAGSPLYYIGSPLLQDWFRLPLPSPLPSQLLESLRKSELYSDSGLVTKMQNGVVVSYKIVWILRPDISSDELVFMVYFSETGAWERRIVTCTRLRPTFSSGIALNGILHWLSQDSRSLVAYDFYGGDEQLRVMQFPGKDDERRRFKRTFTTSDGSIVYFNKFDKHLRVWRLVKYMDCPDAWQLSWEVEMSSSLMELGGGDFFPVVMHPLNSEVIYLWSIKKICLVLLNLRTHAFRFHKENAADESECMDGCILSFNRCDEYMADMYWSYLRMNEYVPNHLFFSQYVLPLWLHRLPRPRPRPHPHPT